MLKNLFLKCPAFLLKVLLFLRKCPAFIIIHLVTLYGSHLPSPELHDVAPTTVGNNLMQTT